MRWYFTEKDLASDSGLSALFQTMRKAFEFEHDPARGVWFLRKRATRDEKDKEGEGREAAL
jgi:hypothetical protein